MPPKKSSKHASGRKTAAKRGTAASKKKIASKRPVATRAAKRPAPKKRPAKNIVAKKGAPRKKKKPIAAAATRKSTAAAKKPVKAPAKKPAVRAKAAAPKKRPAKAAAPVASVQRRDSGHIERKYGQELLERAGAREEEKPAFLGGPRTSDDLAEGLGEEFVETATSGEDEGEEVANQVVSEERGGPFVITTAGTEFADGVDESNPKGAKREPFPTT